VHSFLFSPIENWRHYVPHLNVLLGLFLPVCHSLVRLMYLEKPEEFTRTVINFIDADGP
jgi:hypothetical protein